MNPSTPFYADKSFYLVILGLFLPLLGKKLGIEFDTEAIAGMIATIVGFIVASKWKQAAIIKEQIKAESAKAVAAAPAAATPADALKDAAK